MSRFLRRNRRANSALPGYDNIPPSHPAYREPEPVEGYGIDSDFGEGVHMGPYSNGEPPASYGWTPDHPAQLRKAMERKASKCIRIAEAQLGRRASVRDVENLALRFMDLPNKAINSKLARLADDTVMQNALGRAYRSGPANAHSEVVSDMFADDGIVDDIGLAEMIDANYMGEDHESTYMGEDHESTYMGEDHESTYMGEMHDANYMGEMIDANYMGDMNHPNYPNHMAEDHEAGMAQFGRGAEMHDAMIMSEMHDAMDDHEAMDMASILAEQVEALKKANYRLASQIRKLSDDAVAKGTGYSDTEEELMEESVEEPKGLERLASALADFFADEEEGDEELSEEESILSNILAEVESSMGKKAKKSEEEADEEEADEEEAKASSKKAKKAKAKKSEEEADEEEADEEEADAMGLDGKSASVDDRLARIFQATEEEADEEEADEEEADEEEADEEEAKASSKKASPRPRKSSRKASVKTLGSISREASAGADELSKLWQTAPDVSKYFG